MYVKAFIFTIVAAIFGGNRCNPVVQAFSSGSPTCFVGNSSVGNRHTTNQNIVNGSLAFGSFYVKICSTVLNSTSVNTISPNTDLPLVVSSVNNTQFRGVQVILNQPGINSLSNLFFSTAAELFTAPTCDMLQYGSFVQANSALKQNTTATINLPGNRSSFLDVNVVVALNENISMFFYTRFQLITPAPTKAPTKIPTKTPTKAPSKNPSKAPSKMPTKAPSKSPTRTKCGLFGLNIFCFNGCGLFGQLLGFCG